jgi:methanogenic corrinoid protein MtbC1
MKSIDDKFSLSVTAAAARDYGLNINNLIIQVDNAMIARRDISALVGEDGMDMMKINHMNHSAFMSAVFLLNRFSLLEVTLPWVYRAYHNHGFSYDYFLIELNAWIEAVRMNLQPENAESIIKIYEWMLKNHEKIIELSLTAVKQEYIIDYRWTDTYELFFKSLLNGETYKYSEIAHNSCRVERDLKDFYLNVLQPSLYRIGDLWESGEISAAVEHLATAIVTRTISHLSFLYMPVASRDKRVMVLSVSGEYHQLGALMVANCFEMDKWNVNFLADSMPFRDTMQHIASFKPHLLALSVTMPYNITSMIELIKKIKSGGYNEGMKILAGGQAFKLFPDLPEKLGADAYAIDCIDAVTAGNNLTERKL